MLAALGLQNKVHGIWTPTSKASGHVSKHSWAKGSKSGYNLKWKLSFVKSTMENT